MPDTSMLSDEEFAQLDPVVRQRFVEVEQLGRDAVTLYDLGVARGLLLALKKDGLINASQLDRMFKRVHAATPQEVVATIPPQYAANYGRGVIVPASRGTRETR